MPAANGVLRWEVDEMEKFLSRPGSLRESPPKVIGGLEWRLRVYTECSHRTNFAPSLGAYLTCRYPGAKQFWRAETQYTIALINEMDPIRSRGGEITFNNVCYPDNEIDGHLALETIDNIMDYHLAFNIDSIVMEANITVGKTLGVEVEIGARDFSEPNETSDLCLIVEFKRVHVTRAILAEHSPVFKRMFYGAFEENGKREIELKDVKHKDFVELLNLIYTSLHGISDNSVESILALADRFNMKIALEAAAMFLMHQSRLDLAKKLLLTDTYKLDNAQACLIYYIKNQVEMRLLQRSDSYRQFSDVLKARICDRVAELP